MWENFESIAALFKSIKKTLPIKGSTDDELRVLQVAKLGEGRAVIARHVIFRVQKARRPSSREIAPTEAARKTTTKRTVSIMLPLFQTFKTMKDCDGSDECAKP